MASSDAQEMAATDASWPQHDMQHGVELSEGERVSLVIWFSDATESCSRREAPWLERAAAEGDDIAQVRGGSSEEVG